MSVVELVARRSPRLANLIAMPASRQLMRYAFAGLCVTQFTALVYSLIVLYLHLDPLMANVLSTSFGLGAGYLVHSRWSFAADTANSEAWQVGRFLVASLFAFMVNTSWVWLLTKAFHLPALAPVPLMILATPWISFLLNRYWVFKSHLS